MHNSVLNDLKDLASKDLTNATAMPKELYSSIEILNLEEDLIFSKEWICVGRENEIPEVGDYFTFEIANSGDSSVDVDDSSHVYIYLLG